MTIFFSALKNGFLDSNIFGDLPSVDIPDAVAVTDQEYSDFRADYLAGKTIEVSGSDVVSVDTQISLSDTIAMKSNEIASTTRAAVTGGFVSDALGTDHFYGTLETDQLNLSALVALDADRIYPCRDESDQSWDRRAHTVAQLRTVMTTGTDYIQTILIQKDVFVAQLLAIAADSLLTDDEKRTQINALVIQY